jgi:DNA-binding NtrC family response regulator
MTDRKPKTIEQMEREMIFAALKRNNNNQNATARELGVSPATIRNKLKRYGLTVMREVVVPYDPNANEEKEFQPYQPVKLKG